MEALLDRLARPVSRAPRITAAVIVALTVLLGYITFSTTKADAGSIEDFASDTPAAVTADQIRDLFGSDASATTIAQLAVVDATGDVLSPHGVALAAQLVATLSADPAVQAALPPADSPRPPISTWADLVLGGVQSQGLDLASLDDDTVDALQAGALEQLPPEQAAQVSVLLGGEVDGADASAGMMLIFLDSSQDADVLHAARDAINAQAVTQEDGSEIYSLDFEALDAEVNDAVESQLGQLLGVAFLLILLILVGIYRSFTDVVTSLGGLVMAIIWSQGLGTLLGPRFLGLTGEMSQMAMAIPILLVGLGVDYGIHLTMRTREEKADGSAPEASAARAIHAVGVALLLATVTTVVGFGTNLANPLPPLQDFGVFAAVGVLAAFLVMTAFVPAVRVIVDQRRVRKGKPITRSAAGEKQGLLGTIAGSFAPAASHRPYTVLAVVAAITVAAAGMATQISTEFSQTDFFPDGSRALETVEVITDSFGAGLDETTQVLVTGDVASGAGLAALARFQQGLAGLDGVRAFGGVAQADSVISRLSATGIEPFTGSPEELAGALAGLRDADPTLTSVLVDDAALLRVSTSAGEHADELRTAIRSLAGTTLAPADLEVAATSDALLISEILDQLRASQVKGLVITLAASMLILALVFWARQRAPMLGVMAIASVGVTTIWVFGLMVVLGIPFNVMTAMVSALAIGIGVPFGIHVVNRFLEDRAESDDTLAAMSHTLHHTGGALVGSAVTTVAGFGVLTLSTVPPMRQFGLVVAITIALALVSSLTVLPAMLSLWDGRRRRSERDAAVTAEAVVGVS